MPKKPQETNKGHVSNLLQIYKNRIRPPQSSVEKEVVLCIKEITGLELEQKQVVYTVSSKTISLQVPSILKTEIKASETAIKECLKKKLHKESIPNILL